MWTGAELGGGSQIAANFYGDVFIATDGTSPGNIDVSGGSYYHNTTQGATGDGISGGIVTDINAIANSSENIAAIWAYSA